MSGNKHTYEKAKAWMDTICEYAKALDPKTWERLEELDSLKKTNQSEKKELRALMALERKYWDEGHAREMAQEAALSVELSGTWAAGETPKANGFVILLTTGGPALRIVGELNQYQEPSRAWLEYQDWDIPWTEYHGDNSDMAALLTFCSCFYFGE